MLYFKDGQWHICPFAAFYTAHGQRECKYTNDPRWWEEFVNKWWHHSDLSFVEIEPTDAQLARLAEVNQAGIDERHGAEVALYVERGILMRDEDDIVSPTLAGFTEQPDYANCIEQELIRQKRAKRFRDEADVLDFKERRGEVPEGTWQAKVDEIRADLPYLGE